MKSEPIEVEKIGTGRTVFHYADGSRVVERYNEDGSLWYRIGYFGKHQDGLAEYWWPNGQMLCRETWFRGRLHGLQETWKEDGTPSKHIEYVKGRVKRGQESKNLPA